MPYRERLEKVLRVMLDENKFLSPYGIRSLSKFHQDNHYILEVEGQQHNLRQVAAELSKRLSRLFLPDENGIRPALNGAAKFQTDEHWRDLLLFHEYFDGDTGKGLGATHQTGWTGLVAKLLQQNGE